MKAVVTTLLWLCATQGALAAEGTVAQAWAAQVASTDPIVLSLHPDGIHARAASSAKSTVVLAGQFTFAVVDEHAQVLWLGAGRGKRRIVQALDLRSAAPDLVTVVDQVPATTATANSFSWTVRYPHYVIVRAGADAGLMLNATAPQPTLEPIAGLELTLTNQAEPYERTMKRARLRGGELLRTALTRARAGIKPAPKATRLPLPTGPCAGTGDPKACGRAVPLARTPYLQVTVSESCGDACYSIVQLYDPRSKRFFDVANPKKAAAKPLANVRFDDAGQASPDGAWYAAGRTLTRFSDGLQIKSAQPIIGWLPQGR